MTTDPGITTGPYTDTSQGIGDPDHAGSQSPTNGLVRGNDRSVHALEEMVETLTRENATLKKEDASKEKLYESQLAACEKGAEALKLRLEALQAEKATWSLQNAALAADFEAMKALKTSADVKVEKLEQDLATAYANIEILAKKAAKQAGMDPKSMSAVQELATLMQQSASTVMKAVAEMTDRAKMEERFVLAATTPTYASAAAAQSTTIGPLLTPQHRSELEKTARHERNLARGYTEEDMKLQEDMFGTHKACSSNVVAACIFVTGFKKSPDPNAFLKYLQKAPGYEDVYLAASRIGKGDRHYAPYYQLWVHPDYKSSVEEQLKDMGGRIASEYNPRLPPPGDANNPVAKANAISNYAQRVRWIMNQRDCRPEVRNAIEEDARTNDWAQLLFSPGRITLREIPITHKKGKQSKKQQQPAAADEHHSETEDMPHGSPRMPRARSLSTRPNKEESVKKVPKAQVVVVDEEALKQKASPPTVIANSDRKRPTGNVYEVLADEALMAENQDDDPDYQPGSETSSDSDDSMGEYTESDQDADMADSPSDHDVPLNPHSE